MPADPGHAVVLASFLEQLKLKYYSAKSIDSYSYCTIRFLTYIEKNNKRLKEITKQDVLDYGAYLKGQGYAPASIERCLCSIRKLFAYLAETFYILVNPLESLTLSGSPQKIPVVLTEKEVKRLISQPNTSTLSGIRDRALLELLYSCGLRIGELYNLTIFDIDIQNGFLRVSKSKFSKDRFAPLTKPACYWLKEYISKVRPGFSKNKPKEQALLLGRCGKRLNRQIISRLIRDYARQARINKRVTVHTLRHTLATHLLENNVDISKIQQLLGHSRASVTQRYTKVSPKQIKQEHQKHHPREKDQDREQETEDRKDE